MHVFFVIITVKFYENIMCPSLLLLHYSHTQRKYCNSVIAVFGSSTYRGEGEGREREGATEREVKGEDMSNANFL